MIEALRVWRSPKSTADDLDMGSHEKSSRLSWSMAALPCWPGWAWWCPSSFEFLALRRATAPRGWWKRTTPALEIPISPSCWMPLKLGVRLKISFWSSTQFPTDYNNPTISAYLQISKRFWSPPFSSPIIGPSNQPQKQRLHLSSRPTNNFRLRTSTARRAISWVPCSKSLPFAAWWRCWPPSPLGPNQTVGERFRYPNRKWRELQGQKA